MVEPDLSLPGHPEISVIGDLAAAQSHRQGHEPRPVPGVSPGAKQMGRAAAANILRRLAGQPTQPFRYRDYGNLATIGRNAAVVDLASPLGHFKFSGYFAWLFWLFAHIYFLIGFRNRIVVLIDWASAYWSKQRYARVVADIGTAPGTVSGGEACRWPSASSVSARPRARGEGLRLGTVRRPPRGVPKAEFASRDFYDTWLPNLAPSAELMAQAQAAQDDKSWAAFRRKFQAEMNAAGRQPCARPAGRAVAPDRRFHWAAIARTRAAATARCCANCSRSAAPPSTERGPRRAQIPSSFFASPSDLHRFGRACPPCGESRRRRAVW